MSFVRVADRSCKVIAFGRLILASFFLVAASLGLDRLIAYPVAAWTICLAYAALSLLVVAVTWSNWWLEHRLRLPMHVVDIGFFLALSLATGLQVANPFFLFFVFLVLSAAAKWGWRGAIWTSAAAIALFAASIATEAYFGSLTAEDQARAVIDGLQADVVTLVERDVRLQELFIGLLQDPTELREDRKDHRDPESHRHPEEVLLLAGRP